MNQKALFGILRQKIIELFYNISFYWCEGEDASAWYSFYILYCFSHFLKGSPFLFSGNWLNKGSSSCKGNFEIDNPLSLEDYLSLSLPNRPKTMGKMSISSCFNCGFYLLGSQTQTRLLSNSFHTMRPKTAGSQVRSHRLDSWKLHEQQFALPYGTECKGYVWSACHSCCAACLDSYGCRCWGQQGAWMYLLDWSTPSLSFFLTVTSFQNLGCR